MGKKVGTKNEESIDQHLWQELAVCLRTPQRWLDPCACAYLFDALNYLDFAQMIKFLAGL